MAADDILLDTEDRMDKAIQHLKQQLAGIRTGRANPGLVDSLRVEVYGSPTPIKQLATVGAPEPQQIVIRPYDPGTIKDIEKAIVNSDLGFTPQNDGRVIRLNVPPLSTDTRKKLVARIKELTEEAKVSIRNVRRDGNKAAEQGEKDSDMTEDDRDQAEGRDPGADEEVRSHGRRHGEETRRRSDGRRVGYAHCGVPQLGHREPRNTRKTRNEEWRQKAMRISASFSSVSCLSWLSLLSGFGARDAGVSQ